MRQLSRLISNPTGLREGRRQRRQAQRLPRTTHLHGRPPQPPRHRPTCLHSTLHCVTATQSHLEHLAVLQDDSPYYLRPGYATPQTHDQTSNDLRLPACREALAPKPFDRYPARAKPQLPRGDTGVDLEPISRMLAHRYDSATRSYYLILCCISLIAFLRNHRGRQQV